MKNRLFVLLVCSLACLASAPAQSPWVRSKAGMYAQVAYHFIPEYGSLFGNDGADPQQLERPIKEGTAQLYAEYGLTRKTTIIGVLPYRMLKSGDALVINPANTGGSLSGLGNVSLGLRRQILGGPWPLTVTLRADLPSGRYDNATGLRTAYDAATILPMVSTGHGFGMGYVFGYAGFGYRTNQYSDFLNAGIEGGIKFSKLWLIAFTELVRPLGNGAVTIPQANQLTGLFVDNQEYLSVGFKGILEINRFLGVLVSFAGAPHAELVPQSPGLGAGVYFKWD